MFEYWIEYLVAGFIVYMCIFKKFAYNYANSSKWFRNGPPVGRGIRPGIGDYIVALLWGPVLIIIWPLIIVYFVVKTNF